MIARLFQRKADFAGIFASTLCLIHCLLAPLLAVSLPFLDHHYHGSWFGLDSLFVLLSLVAVWFAARGAHTSGVRLGLWLSWVAFAAGIILHIQGIEAGELLSYGGSLALIVSHLINFRSHRSHSH